MVSVHGLLLCGWAVYELVRIPIPIPILTGGGRATEAKDEKFGGWLCGLWMDKCLISYWLLSLVLLLFYYIILYFGSFLHRERDRMDICDPLTHSFIIDIYIFIYYFL